MNLGNMFKSVTKGINKLIGNQSKFTIKGREFYEERLLAEGGYGYVYLVEEAQTKQKFALKKMNIQDANQFNIVNKEVDIWLKINNHPNIIRLIDYDITQTAIYILMELSPDGSLLDFINNSTGNVSEKEALYITKEIASGIDHMHSLNPPVAHRDLKIENVLRMGNNYKICDFGSASTQVVDLNRENKNSIQEHFTKFEKTTTFMYRPPEMCDQYCKYTVNEKVDVWMLGCILYALLFKKHPFQDAQRLTIINAHYYMPEEADSYSEKIIDLIRLMLTPNPANRPSMKNILSIIKNWSSISSIPLPPETQEIKSKHIQTNTKHKPIKEISPEEIYRVQQQIMKDLERKNKYNRKKDDDEDINDIFKEDQDDEYIKGKKSSHSESPEKLRHLTTNSHSSKNDGWLIDFNNEFTNNVQVNNANVDVNDNLFGFEFFDNKTNAKQTNNSNFSDMGNVFSHSSNNTSSHNKANQNISFPDFTFTDSTPNKTNSQFSSDSNEFDFSGKFTQGNNLNYYHNKQASNTSSGHYKSHTPNHISHPTINNNKTVNNISTINKSTLTNNLPPSNVKPSQNSIHNTSVTTQSSTRKTEEQNQNILDFFK